MVHAYILVVKPPFIIVIIAHIYHQDTSHLNSFNVFELFQIALCPDCAAVFVLYSFRVSIEPLAKPVYASTEDKRHSALNYYFLQMSKTRMVSEWFPKYDP